MHLFKFLPIFALLITHVSSCKSQENLPEIPTGLISFATQVGGDTRTYSVYLPPTVARGSAAAGAVLLFHGSNGSGGELSFGTDIDSEFEEANFIAVYPDAPLGNWAEDCRCNNADRLQVNDTAFVRIMLEEIKEAYTFPEEKVFAVGFSQGGLFAQRLACQMSDSFAGYGIVAANMSVPLSQRCSPGNNISQIIIQGKQDRTLPYVGSNNGALSLVPTQNVIRFWAQQNGCDLDNSQLDADEEREILQYCTEQTGSSLSLISSVNGGHSWFLPGVNTNQELVNFFVGL